MSYELRGLDNMGGTAERHGRVNVGGRRELPRVWGHLPCQSKRTGQPLSSVSSDRTEAPPLEDSPDGSSQSEADAQLGRAVVDSVVELRPD
jgi:hypothetical protein